MAPGIVMRVRPISGESSENPVDLSCSPRKIGEVENWRSVMKDREVYGALQIRFQE